MIDVENLSVSLAGTRVLEAVNLRVDPGEFVGLVGPNGAGKTTLLRAINGSQPTDSGTITLDGASIDGLGARETSRRVATVHQDTSVQFAFDVETVVAMGRTPHRSRLGGDPDGPAHVDRALRRTEIEHLRERRISDVSGGERQRVFIARALVQDAPALLLDEPTASLDVNHAARTLSLVRRLVDEGKAALGAIHDLEAAARYCDRLVMLNEGQVVARGPPADVLTDASIEAAFDVRSVVTTNPATGTPTVTALPATTGDGHRVHVLGGGPVGARLVGDLWARGHAVSVGPLPAGDAAVAVADSLGVETVTVPGLAPIDEASRARTRELIGEAVVTVLADPVLSPGTPALSLAEDASALLLVEERPLAERNYAGDDGKRQYEKCRQRASVVSVTGVPAAVETAADSLAVSTASD